MPLYFAQGSPDSVIDTQRMETLIDAMLSQIGPLKRVLLIPPDFTRCHSGAGEVASLLYKKLHPTTHIQVLPALGTHVPMTPEELEAMFPGIPLNLFREHDWRNDLVRLGEVPGEFVHSVSEGKLSYPISCEVNRILFEEKWDHVFSIGQLVPHEVAGIANHNKNILVGIGGRDTINKTHFLGAVHGLERMMGHAKTPVRAVFNYMDAHFLKKLSLSYILLVRGKNDQGTLVTCGMYAGTDEECFNQGTQLCCRVNLDLVKHPFQKAVVYLDPTEYKSTWLGNKAIYRTRMAMATGGELIILAPGLKTFGEDPEVDRLIRQYGYRGTPYVLDQVSKQKDLSANLSAAAHLIHGSTEGRFQVTYCPGHLTEQEIKSVGYEYHDLQAMLKRYNPSNLRDGENTMPDCEKIFFISNPALGLWSEEERFLT